MKNYPTGKVKVSINPTMDFKSTGYLINEWLVTSYSNSLYQNIKVFNCFGFPVSNVCFDDFEEANKFAEFLEENYKDYWILWHDNPKADIPGLTRYTIENGLEIYETLTKFDNKIVNFEDVKNECSRISS